MAVGLRGLFKLNLGLTNAVFSKSNFLTAGVRFMYSERDLGITGYENTRFLYRNQFVSIEDTFRDKMKEICVKEDGIIFTEDLKAMIHLAQPNQTDLKLIHDMLVKYVKFKAAKPISQYIFGTVIMRMCYYLNEPNFALSLFDDASMNSSFNYYSAIRVLLCLLFKHQMYNEMRHVMQVLLEKEGPEFVISNTILLYAACLKQNTPESAQFAIQQWRDHVKVRIPSLRATSMVAYLAVKHDACEEALEMISVLNRDNVMSVKCIKILAYAKLKKFLSVIPLLKYSAEQEVVVPNRFGFYEDVISELKKTVEENNSPEQEQILRLIEKLKEQRRVEPGKTMEEFLLRPLVTMRRDATKFGPKPSENEPRQGMQGYL